MIETLPARVNGDAALMRRGRFVDTTFLLEVGETPWLITIAAGRVASVVKGPFAMASWTFALRAPADAWAKFWAADPEPGFHDLFALIKQRLLKAEGNLHPFMANLFYFKGVLGALREARVA
jgi:hypothetical protein